jgi:hypothetical protein
LQGGDEQTRRQPSEPLGGDSRLDLPDDLHRLEVDDEDADAPA